MWSRSPRANRDVIAVGLRAMAELKMAQGDSAQAIDLYKQLSGFRRHRRRPILLWRLPTWPHTAPTKRLHRSSPSPRSDPQNGDAWNVQGKLLMDKKSYGPAAEALARSLQLQSNPFVAYALASAYLNLGENDKAAGNL